MPRPKKATVDKVEESTTKTPANKQKGKKICTCCHKEKKMTDYYISHSPIFSLDERVPICKDCCKNSCLNEDGSINFEKFKELLRTIDKPLYYDLIASSESTIKKEHSYLQDDQVKYMGSEILSQYFKNIAMRQDRNKTYSDSEKDEFMHQNNNRTKKEKEDILNRINNNTTVLEDEIPIKIDKEDFDITKDIIDLFGEGYTKSEYKKMHDKYEKLKLNYTLQTNLHQEALATYVRFKVKEEEATAKGDVDEAKKWYDAAQNAASNGKLTPKQLSAADFQKGMNSVSELIKAVEQATDVIKIMPQFKYRPIDAVDFTIMCYINYERKLNGQPEVDYSEIYSFYDKKVEEYIAQNGDPYGIFDNDPTKKNRDNVKKFLTMPDDYDELVGDANDN